MNENFKNFDIFKRIRRELDLENGKIFFEFQRSSYFFAKITFFENKNTKNQPSCRDIWFLGLRVVGYMWGSWRDRLV